MIIWQPGQQINNGRFIIQGKPLASGGFGTTYKDLEPSTGKLYAIKTLNQQMQLKVLIIDIFSKSMKSFKQVSFLAW